MVFPVVGGDGKPTGYEISNSLRYNYGDSPKLIKSGTSAGSTTFTFSAWLKFSVTNFYNFIFCSGDQIGLAKDRTQSGGQFYLNGASGGTYTNSDGFQRDPSAWYHAVVSCNSGTGIIYVNNVNRKGSINIPQLGNDLAIGHFMRTAGVETPQYDYYMDGYMSEVHFVDGTALNPSSFAEYNDNGVWIPKDCKDDLTYGTNGFYLQFKETGTSANSSGIGADTSGNDNHFTPTNLAATDVTTDTPTNNFATLNPLAVSRFSSGNAAVFAEGNCQIATQTSDNDRVLSVSTFGVTSGKWYWEVKAVVAAKCETGVVEANTVLGYSQHFNNESDPRGISIDTGGHIYAKGGGDYDDHENWAPDLNNNDIIMYALDMDNYELWHGINGTWSDSGDPTSGATGTGGIVNQSGNSYRTNLNHGDPMFPMVQDGSTGGQMKAEFNFGNAPFSISSGNADANGYGNFEYAPPSGFYALCTKNLAEYG